MAVNFPNSPSNNDTFASGSKTYQYDATKGVWNIQTVTTTTDTVSYTHLTLPTNDVV